MTQSSLSTAQALQEALQYPDGMVTLRYAALGMVVKLAQRGAQVCWMSSPTLPAWPTYLHAAQIPAELTQQVIEVAGLQPLLDAGYAPQRLQELCQERLLYALLPFMAFRCTLEYRPLTRNVLLEAGSLALALEPLQAISAALAEVPSLAAPPLSPAQVLLANPLYTGPLTAQQQAIYGALLRGRTLGQVCAELPLRWDRLCAAIAQLQPLASAVAAPLGSGAAAQEVQPALLSQLPQRAYPPLQAGDQAPDFCLPQLGGPPVRLSQYQGQKVWLIFNRQAACGFCVPRHQVLVEVAPELQRQNIQVLSVWGSSVELMYSGVGQLPLPFPVLPDPYRLVFQRYHVRHKRGAALNIHSIRHWRLVLRGLELVGVGALRLQGEGQRLPAEFLIDEMGRVVRAHYNRYVTDWLSPAEVLAWTGGV